MPWITVTAVLLLASPNGAETPLALPDNAAADYVVATKAYKDPTDGDLLGLDPTAPLPESLNPALQANSIALERLTAGAAKAKCTFPLGSLRSPDVPAIELLRLGRLALLRARSRHASADEAGAVSDLQTVLRLAGHLGGVAGAVPRAAATQLEKLTVATFEGLGRTSKHGCATFAGTTRSYLKSRPDAESLLADERRLAHESVAVVFAAAQRRDAGPVSFVAAANGRIDAWFDAFVPYATSHRTIDRGAITFASDKLRADKKAALEQLGSPGLKGDPVAAATELIRSGKLTTAQLETVLATLTAAAIVTDYTAIIDDNFAAVTALTRASSVSCR